MYRLRRAAAVLVVALMLAVAAVPLADTAEATGSEQDSGFELKSTDTVPYMQKNDNGTFTFRFPYLEDTLGINPKPVDFNDPSHGAIDIRPMEIHYFDGSGVNEMYKPTAGSDGSMGEYGIPYDTVMSLGIARGVEFGMLLKDNEDGHEDIVNYGININGVYFLQMAGAEGKITFDSSQSEYMTYVVNNYSCVSPMQSVNLLPYTVGNFTEDDSEEIALFMGDCIYLCDYADGSIVHYDTLYLEKNTSSTVDPYGHAPMLNPVSMTAGDTDGDGIDEILVSVEYSETHESPQACCMGSHMTILSLMDPDDKDVRTSRVYTEYRNTITDEDTGSSSEVTEKLDSVMTSVCLDDIDLDGDFEIVIGGYMWDNGNHAFGTTLDKRYCTGELYLGLLSPDDIKDGANVFPDPVVRPMDDDGTASNGIDPDNKYDDRDEYEHYPKDTSIFTEDGAENDFGYCRSNNWMNWTIPLIVLDMRGNGYTNTVYFDYSLFDVTTEGFDHLTNLEPPYVQDNNNCCLISLDAAAVHPRDDYCLAYQDLFRFMALDTKGSGDVLWHADLNYMVDGTVYRQEMASSVYYEWEGPESDAPVCCLVDWDASDTIRAKYVGSVSTITDPVVLAAVSAIPYDDDLANMLIRGNNEVGSTSFLMHSESGESTDSTVSTSFEMGGSLDTMFMSASASGGWFGDIGSSRTQSISLDVEFNTSTDSVVMYLTPYYSHTYLAFMGNGGQPKTELQTITEFDEPVMVILQDEEYNEFILQYNELMSLYAEASTQLAEKTGQSHDFEFVDVPTIKPFGHTEGDPKSYNGEGKEPLVTPKEFVYFGDKDAGSQNTTVMLSESNSDTTTGGAMMNMELSSGFVMFFDFGAGFESSTSRTTSDTKGVGFSAEVSQGLTSAYYKPNTGEANEVLSQYAVEGNLWASLESVEDSDDTYLYVGYTVTDANAGAKLGELVPDVALQNDPDDKDDPMNPAYGKTYLEMTIPGTYRDYQAPMYYTLQMEFQDFWYDASITWTLDGKDFELGINEVVFENGEPVVEEKTFIEDGKEVVKKVPVVRPTGDTYTGDAYCPDLLFVPHPGEDRVIWLEVSGLERFTEYYNNGLFSFNFRLVGYQDEPAKEKDDRTLVDNPNAWTTTRQITAYTSNVNSNVIANCDYALEENILHLFPEELESGHNIIYRTLDLVPGTVLTVKVYDPDSDREFVFDDVVVGVYGVVTVAFEYQDSRSVPAPVAAIVFLGILVCLGAGWYVLRKS